MNKERLITLREFLKTLKQEQFEYNAIVSKAEGNCGTTCCAIGWMPKIDPENFQWFRHHLKGPLNVCMKGKGGFYYTNSATEQDAAEYFDIPASVADTIFWNADKFYNGSMLDNQIRPAHLIEIINWVLENNPKDSSYCLDVLEYVS